MAPYDNLKNFLCISFFMVLTIFAPLLGFGQALIHSQHSAFVRAPQSEPEDDVTLILKLKKGVHQEATGLDGQRIDLTNGAAIEVKIPRMYKENIESGRDSISINLLRAFAGDSKQNIKILDYGRGRKQRVDPLNPPKATIDISSLAFNQEIHYVGPEAEDATPVSKDYQKKAVEALKKKNAELAGIRLRKSHPDEVKKSDTEATYDCFECQQKALDKSGPSSGANQEDLNKVSEALTSIQPQTKEEVDEMYASYSNDPRTLKLVGSIRRLGPYNRRVRPYCYRHFKNQIKGSGLVSDYLDGVAPGVFAGPELERHGFVNIYDPKNPGIFADSNMGPQGAVYVYEGGPYGHVEVKTGKSGEGGFGAQFWSINSRTGRGTEIHKGNRNRHRKLIGIYVLPNQQVKMARK